MPKNRRTKVAQHAIDTPAPVPVSHMLATGWSGPALIALLAVITYANAVNNPFHFDDHAVIVSDPRVTEGQIGRLLTEGYWPHENADLLYRPAAMLSYAANWAVAPHAWAFRIVNLAGHVGVSLLLFALMRRVFQARIGALAAGLLFAVHPLGAEPINTIVGRADILATLCMLASLLLFWRDVGVAVCSSWRLPIGAAAMFAVALLFKESAIVLPALVLVLDLWRRFGRNADSDRSPIRRRLLRCYFPMLAVIALYLLARYAALDQLSSDKSRIEHFNNPIAHPEQTTSGDDSTTLARWGTPLVTFARAVKLGFLPTDLCFDYSFAAIEPVQRWGDARMWIGLILLAALAGAWIIVARSRSALAVAIAFWCVCYALVANVFVVIGTIFGDRLIYAPALGVCMGTGWLIESIAKHRNNASPHAGMRQFIGNGLLVALLIACVALSIARNRDWRSMDALYESAYAVNPRSCKVLAGTAEVHLKRNQLPEALASAMQSIDIAPDYWPASYTAGVVLDRMAQSIDDPARRQTIARQAMLRYVEALRRGGGADIDAVIAAARHLRAAGDTDQAVIALESLLEHLPHAHQAWYELAVTHAAAGHIDAAMRAANNAIDLSPRQTSYQQLINQLADAAATPTPAP